MKPVLAKHKKFAELSKKFVMVNTEDNDEPKGDQFDVDGKYVPRIFFLGKNTGETSTIKLYRISSRFFENEPSGMCSHLCKKEPKGRFFSPDKPEITLAKEKERIERKNEEEEKRRQRKKQWLHSLESFWAKKMLDGRSLFGGNVFKISG